jgi:hypothetical protein
VNTCRCWPLARFPPTVVKCDTAQSTHQCRGSTIVVAFPPRLQGKVFRLISHMVGRSRVRAFAKYTVRVSSESNALGFFYSAQLQARLANTAVVETCPNIFQMMRLETDKNVTDVLAVVLFANSRTFKPCFPISKWHCHISIVYVVISWDHRWLSFSLACHLSVISVFLRSCCGRFICLGLCMTSTLLKFVSDYGFFQIIFGTSALVTETPKPVPDHHSLRISWAIVPEWQLTFDNQFF